MRREGENWDERNKNGERREGRRKMDEKVDDCEEKQVDIIGFFLIFNFK